MARDPVKRKAAQTRYAQSEKGKAYKRAYAAANKERIKAYQEQYRADHNDTEQHREYHRTKQAEYRAEKPDQYRSYQRENYYRHQEDYQMRAKRYRCDSPVRSILARAKYRASQKNIEFDLSEDDIVIPDTCPVFGFPLLFGAQHNKKQCASIDRIDNDKGYVRGNVIIVSNLANTVKGQITVERMVEVADEYERRAIQLRQVAQFYSGLRNG